LEDQLNMYRQQRQADQQKQIIAKMAGKMQANQMIEKEKIMKDIILIQIAVAVAVARAIMADEAEEDAEEAEEVAEEDAATIVSI
jgi:hypothetical protein